MLELWRPPPDSGDPIGCLATTYTFTPGLFEEQCLARFLEIGSDPDREDLAFLLEREGRLGSVYAGVVVDHTQAGVEHSLRWDILPVRIPGGRQHAKLSVLAWSDHIRIIVASANLTEPGYRTNYEVAATIDLSPKEANRELLAQAMAFLRDLLTFVPRGPEGSPEVQRAEAYLAHVERRGEAWTRPRGKTRVRQQFACTLPAVPPRQGERSSLKEALAICRRRGGSPYKAWIASPFFDADDDRSRVAAALCQSMARGRSREICFCVPAVLEDGGPAIPRLAAPKAIASTPLNYRGRVSVEMLPALDEDNNPRRWHAKMLALRGDTYTALLIGSSNFTSAGMGVASHRNAEANLVTVAERVAFGRETGNLEAIWPQMEVVQDLDTAEWLGPQSDHDEEGNEPAAVVPRGFLSVTYRAGDERQIVVFLDPGCLPPAWRIHSCGQDDRELLNQWSWTHMGSPAVASLNWPPKEPPYRLLVSWNGQEAFLPLNVENPEQLPPPAQVDQMCADDILRILAAADPSAAFRTWARGQQPSDTFDSDLDSATPSDLDPLRRYDLQATFLHRIRRRARILASLRGNLQRPVYGRPGLEWRLRGMIGIEILAERLVRDVDSTEGRADEALLTLADFLIVLREVDYQPSDGSLTKPEFEEVFRPFLRARRKAPGADPRTASQRFGRFDGVLATGPRAMSMKNNPYTVPPELVLGKRMNDRVSETDQMRQREEAKKILSRLRRQPGVILADEVGMGKTFVALAVAYSTALGNRRGPVVVMVPPNLIDKWEQDLATFCELYLENRHPVRCDTATARELTAQDAVRYGTARHSVDLMRLLDDPPRRRCHFILLAQGAMSRSQTDKWVRLALIAEALRRYGRAKQLIKVRKQIHRFLAELLWAIGEERAHDWGDELWKSLLKADPSEWKGIYNSEVRNERRQLDDDPVPKSVARALQLRRINLLPLAEALKQMPLRATGGKERVSERLDKVRNALKEVEDVLWRDLLAKAHWRSPLLIMDEAHHLKNPGTSLARQLQSPDLDRDLRTGDGAMAGAFDRMLFLTATPFQLGHHELVRVLERFSDVRWDSTQLGEREEFLERLQALGRYLDDSQRAAVALQRRWSRLRPEDCEDENMEAWWVRLRGSPLDELTSRQRAVVEGFEMSRIHRNTAEKYLRPWIVRHNKGTYWSGTGIKRRRRVHGAGVAGQDDQAGLPVPSGHILPFFLAARSAVNPGKDLLGEALCSSYEAFRNTREQPASERDGQDDEPVSADLTHSAWYLREFDTALKQCTGNTHPKVGATVEKTVDLWEAGEKVLVFAFYRQTCAALRIHIRREIEKRTAVLARLRLARAEGTTRETSVTQVLKRIQVRYFDHSEAPGRRELNRALLAIVDRRREDLFESGVQPQDLDRMVRVMRRFLRVPTTIVRCFPIEEHETLEPEIVVERMLDKEDASSVTWREKFGSFVDFLTDYCSTRERKDYLDATAAIRTAGIANVQMATGITNRDTRSRLMRAFNTPFFPDIFVCSQVMGEGVDLQRYCRHVIHHDLAWNPSSIEQRTGRIDRLGCKAEGKEPVTVYLPYLAGAADDRQFKVMTEREQWFRVVMGQDQVAKLITPDSEETIPLPRTIADELTFSLGLAEGRSEPAGQTGE